METPRQRGLSITATQTTVSVTRVGEVDKPRVVSDELISHRRLLFCRYSDHRLHTGPVPAHRSLRVSASHVLLLRLGTGGLHHLHCR